MPSLARPSQATRSGSQSLGPASPEIPMATRLRATRSGPLSPGLVSPESQSRVTPSPVRPWRAILWPGNPSAKLMAPWLENRLASRLPGNMWHLAEAAPASQETRSGPLSRGPASPARP